MECRAREQGRACAHEYRNEVPPAPARQKPPMGSVVPPDDSARDRIVSPGSTKKYCGRYHRGSGTPLWYPPAPAAALEGTPNPFAQSVSLEPTLVSERNHRGTRPPAAAASRGRRRS